MSTRMFELRDFGQRKRAVTLARGNVNDLITIYDSIKVKTITNPEDAEELRLKLKTHQKSSLPLLRSNFSNRIDDKTYKFHLQRKMENYKQKFKQASKRTRPLKPIKPNTRVLVYDHKRSAFLQKAIVIKRGSTPSSYILEDLYGHQFKRNRRQIKPVTIPRSTKSTTYLM